MEGGKKFMGIQIFKAAVQAKNEQISARYFQSTSKKSGSNRIKEYQKFKKESLTVNQNYDQQKPIYQSKKQHNNQEKQVSLRKERKYQQQWLAQKKQMHVQFQQKILDHQANHRRQLQQLKLKFQNENQRLKLEFATQRESLQKNHHKQKQQLEAKLGSLEKRNELQNRQIATTIDDFSKYIDNNNNHIIAQLKFIDQNNNYSASYKFIQIRSSISQFNDLIQSSTHPQMKKILAEKQLILNNYLVEEMKKMQIFFNSTDIQNFSSLDTENGKIFKLNIQKLGLLQGLNRKNVNESIKIDPSPILYGKIRQLLSKSNQKIFAFLNNNNDSKELEQIKEIDQFLEFKEFLRKELISQEEQCAKQYKEIGQNINIFFNRFSQIYKQIIQNKSTDKLEDYLGKAQKLKKFMEVMHHCQLYKKYSFNLEKHLKKNLFQIKNSLLKILNQISKQLQDKLQALLQQRIYKECYNSLVIFKKFSILNEVLGRQYGIYQIFNFSQLHNKLFNFINIIREEKIHLIDYIITNQKINIQVLSRQYRNITFDQSLRNKYLYKIKNILQNRMAMLTKNICNSTISNQSLNQLKHYHQEIEQLKNIKQIKQLPDVSDQMFLIQEKVLVILDYLPSKFKQHYQNIIQFKELEQANRAIINLYQFQDFCQRQFTDQHQEFKLNIHFQKFPQLPKPTSEYQCVFSLLRRLNISRQRIRQQMISNPDEALKDEHFEFYTNINAHLSHTNSAIVQNKLYKSVLNSIGQLEAKEWSEGEVDSSNERKLLIKLNKLQNKEITFYRQIIANRRSKILQKRQKLIDYQKHKLKENNFKNLAQFLIETKKHESSNPNSYQMNIDILQDYINHSYDSISTDNEKKSYFLLQLYKLNLDAFPEGIKNLFKIKQYKIYFSNFNLLQIRNNITALVNLQAKNLTSVNKITQVLIDMFKLYSIFKNNQENSLLDRNERQIFHQNMELIKSDLLDNYNYKCNSFQCDKIFDQKCDHNQLFSELIKIQINQKLVNSIQKATSVFNYRSFKGKYQKIIQKININIQKVYENVGKFKYYNQELKILYDKNKIFLHLQKIDNIVQVFRQIEYDLGRFDDYLKNNYLQGLNLKKISHKEIIRIVEMAWTKQYTDIKSELYEMFHTHQMDIVLKYKIILHEKEIVKNQNLISFGEIIKEEYDFKKIVIQQLMEIQSKLQAQVQNLERQNETFTFTMKNMEVSKKQIVQAEKEKVKAKYGKLIDSVKDSFHQIDDEEIRQQKIQSEINTLNNQMRDEEQNIFNQENAKTQNFRKKFILKAQKYISRIFEHIMIARKIQNNFDIEIQELCKRIITKTQGFIDQFDSNLKNIFVSYVKKSKNTDLMMNVGSMNMFRKLNQEQFKQNTKAMNGIDKIIKKCPQLANNNDLSQEITEAYQIYQKQLQRIEQFYCQNKSEIFVVSLIKETKNQIKHMNPSIAIARIFAVYSIYKCIDSHQQEITFDGNPHIAQVVSILLLIDAQHQKNAKLDSRLIEVKTGQGKSRVLGGLNCYLALKGYDVYCGCYSSYLSKRDQEEFHSLFLRFGVNSKITYGPFSEHCQSVFNESNKHNFKEVTKKVLLNEKLSQAQLDYLERLNKLLRHESKALRILVIDEVDVFFDQNYFGQLYAPGVAIDSPEVKQLIKFIWENHTDPKLSKIVFQSVQYRNLANLYPRLNQLIKNQVQSMVYACNNFQGVHPYQIRNKQIQYVDNDTVNEKLNFGYSTAFASCLEYEKCRISQQNYNKNTNISLIVGRFSYAELPKYFDHIMGVSGTVEAMSDFRKQMMRKDYNIKDTYIIPSIYGDSHRKIYGFHSCDQEDFLSHLLMRINDVRKLQRPILVFFQTEKQLNMVSSSPQFGQFTKNIFTIKETMPPQARNPLINYAGSRNRITLISSIFSRGTDFTVFDTDINEKGGMHVIQTYISKNQSDFIQILGRTGRQGKNGSFEVIVKKQELTKNGISLVDDNKLQEQIKKTWKNNDLKYGQELKKSIENVNIQHIITFDVVRNLKNDHSKLIDNVMRLNYFQNIRTVIAIDGTGSMGRTLKAVFNILNETISRTQAIISRQKPDASFEHKIMIYRNYNSKPMENILQQSQFSKDPKYLKYFMSLIKPEGGRGNQAQQILFYQIGKICQQDGIDQIIIIGDTPANTFHQLIRGRRKYYGERQWTQRYPLFDSTQKYSEVVALKKIPIYSFYILDNDEDEQSIKNSKVKTHFKNLSKNSGGQADQLHINDPMRALDQLTDLISTRVLDLIGGKKLVDLYTQMFQKRYV